MDQFLIRFNGNDYLATYNSETGYYEAEIQAPETGGIYTAEYTITNVFGQRLEDSQNVQVFAKEQLKLNMNKVFMWIFDCYTFEVKDIVEISDYELNIDEETNANSFISILKTTSAKAQDIVAVKKNNETIYWGIIDNIENEDGKQLYKYTLKYITNLFDQTIKLENENIIKTTGIEDFIEQAINSNFIQNADTFVNKRYLELVVNTHTTKQTSVSNVQDGIYNLHTWMTNCTQNYNVVYDFNIVNGKLVMTIELKDYQKELIDVKAQPISNYSEVFETKIVSKVVVLTSTNTYTLYLLNDRTTTTDGTNPNRAAGRTETVYTENYEDAPQKALDTIKANTYNHNITFKYLDRFIKIGTPIAIKTKKSIIYDTYISSIKITPKNFIEYICGNIRIGFIEKLNQERNK